MRLKFKHRGKKWIISSDSQQYIVYEPVIRKDKEGQKYEQKRNPSYATKLSHAFNIVFDSMLRKSKAKDMEELISELQEIKKCFKAVLDLYDKKKKSKKKKLQNKS